MKKKIIKGVRKRIFDTANTQEVKIREVESNIIITLINKKGNEDNHFRFQCLTQYKKEIYHFLTEDTKENLMEVSSNGEVRFSYQENLL